MELNQVTLPAMDVEKLVRFYRMMGFEPIVEESHYARFKSIFDDATFSVHDVQEISQPWQTVVYFECQSLDEEVLALKAKGIDFCQEPRDEPWLWREARMHDPSVLGKGLSRKRGQATLSCGVAADSDTVLSDAKNSTRANRWHAYHVLNRGNGGATVFHKDGDYAAFLDILVTAKSKFPVKVFGVCLMPNHFHLVLQPATQAALSPFMQWWMTSHVRRYHQHYRSHGHVWQGRFKSFPIQQDGHLLTVLRYVLRNPVRAGLVEHAMDWPWSSMRSPSLSDPLPVEILPEWVQWIDQPLSDHELVTLRTCVNRQQPFGREDWQTQIAEMLGLESTLRQRGRPRKSLEK